MPHQAAAPAPMGAHPEAGWGRKKIAGPDQTTGSPADSAARRSLRASPTTDFSHVGAGSVGWANDGGGVARDVSKRERFFGSNLTLG